MNLKLAQAGLLALWFSTVVAPAQSPDLSGKWQVTVMHHGSAEYATLTLKSADGQLKGEMFGDAITATLSDGQLVVRCQNKDAQGKECGLLKGRLSDGVMNASGILDLMQDHGLHQPRAENDDYVMVMGIANSLEDALRSATTGMSRWLESSYKLNAAEIAMILGSSMHYDIAEIVDPQVHVVAKVARSILKQIE